MKNKKRLIIMMTLIASILVGCSQGNDQGKEVEQVNVYFYNSQVKALEEEEIAITLNEGALSEDKMAAVIEALSKGTNAGNQVAKPTHFHVEEYSLRERIAYVTFEETYQTLNVEEQTGIRSSIVYSLTDLDFIDAVEFYVGKNPLTTYAGIKIGPVSREDFITDSLIPKPPTITQTINLYFIGKEDYMLHKEERVISINPNTPIEEYIIQEVIKGPTTEGLLPILPSSTKINDIRTHEFVCQVDLSYDLGNVQGASEIQEKLVIYSIVNALTESSRIEKVIFLMDGKRQTEFSTTTDAGGVFERNEKIISTK